MDQGKVSGTGGEGVSHLGSLGQTVRVGKSARFLPLKIDYAALDHNNSYPFRHS